MVPETAWIAAAVLALSGLVGLVNARLYFACLLAAGLLLGIVLGLASLP